MILKKKDEIIFLECFVQIIIIYLIFFKFNHKIRDLVSIIFKKMVNKNINDFMLTIIIIAFSTGVYKHLEELNQKTRYIKEKYFGK